MWGSSSPFQSLKVNLALLTLADGASGLVFSVTYFQNYCVGVVPKASLEVNGARTAAL